MNAPSEQVPVLIVGGGPVGLALAIELGWQGVACRLIEQSGGTITHPKMNQVGNRTMEFCRRWGIGEKVRELSIPDDFPRTYRFMTSSTGYELGRFEFPSRRDAVLEHSPEYLQRCSQLWFNPLLARRAASLPGVEIQYDTKLEGFDQDADGVAARVTEGINGESKTIRAQYMVACDGADSGVREALGIGLDGDHSLSFNLNIFFECGDRDTLFANGQSLMQMLFDGDGLWADIVSINGKDLWRLGLMRMPPGSHISDGEAGDLIRRAVGRDVEFRIHSILPWTRRRVVADRYSKGRVFLAGDAVHQMSPTGGFGMNTGIQEAVDIGWKLAATLAGWGGDKLLESYDWERRPVARLITDEGARNFTQFLKLPHGPAIAEDTEEGADIRRRFGQAMVDLRMMREYDTDGIVLGYHYEGSPLIATDKSPPPPFDVMHYRPTARPGHRAPHVWLDDGRSILDLFGKGFVCLKFDQNTGLDELVRAARERGAPFQLVDLAQPAIVGLYGAGLVLVRPDGHVAWRGAEAPAGKEAGALLDKLRGA